MAAMDRAEVGKLIVALRVERGFKTREALAKATELTPRTLSDIEVGRRYSYSPSTLSAVESVLGMLPGTIQAMLDRARAEADTPAELPEEKPQREPVDIAPELATPDGLAMWMRPDPFPSGYLLHHAGLDGQARLRVVMRQRERNDRRLLEDLDAVAADIAAEGGVIRREAWPPWLVERYGWEIPDGGGGATR